MGHSPLRVARRESWQLYASRTRLLRDLARDIAYNYHDSLRARLIEGRGYSMTGEGTVAFLFDLSQFKDLSSEGVVPY